MIRYALLGLIQGLTEFLPVSSSGHLVLAGRWIGLDPPGVLLEAMLHWGTLLAVLLVFRKDLAAMIMALGGRGRIEDRKRIGFLVAGTLPIVVTGLLLRGPVEQAFSSVLVVGIGLIVSAGFLFAASLLQVHARRATLCFSDSMVVGCAQTLSLVPGISRSGVTISTGLVAGLTPEGATRFSFLLSIPALLGAGLLHLIEALQAPQQFDWAGLAIGTAVSFGVGLLAIHALLGLVRRRKLWWFAIYCLGLGLGTLGWSVLTPG